MATDPVSILVVLDWGMRPVATASGRYRPWVSILVVLDWGMRL